MDLQTLLNLLHKYRQGHCSREELKQLNQWYDDFDFQAEQIPAIPQEKLELLLENISQRIDQHQQKKHSMARWWYVAGVAASVLITLGTAWWLNLQQPGELPLEQCIQPGQRCAQLLLSDGSVVQLDSGVVVREIDGTLVKNDSSLDLDYSVLKGECRPDLYNTIRVPIGGEYSLRLADGTRVWMNSGSSLKFPVNFQGDRRDVVLSGEAYFEVTKSTVPFIVKTSDMDIRVLGTSFNVSVYEDDEAATATLLSGSVEVYGRHNCQTYQIVPGNTLTYEKTADEMTIGNVDPEIYTSWIKGEFKFRDMRLEEIMVKLNRWYNCTVSYEEPSLKELRFSGAAEKDRPVNYLLEMIESITDVRFKIEGSQIRVMHK